MFTIVDDSICNYIGLDMYVIKTIRDIIIILLGVTVLALSVWVYTHPFETGRWLKQIDDARYYELDHDTGPILD